MKRDKEFFITFTKHNKITDLSITFTTPLKNIIAIGYAVSQSVKNNILHVSDIMKDNVMAPYYVKFSDENGIDTFFIMKKGKKFEKDEPIVIGEMFYSDKTLNRLKSIENSSNLYKIINSFPCISIFEFINKSSLKLTSREKKIYLEKMEKLTDILGFYMLYNHSETKEESLTEEKKNKIELTIFDRKTSAQITADLNNNFQKEIKKFEKAVTDGKGVVDLQNFFNLKELSSMYVFVSENTIEDAELIVIGRLNHSRKPEEIIRGEIFHCSKNFENYKRKDPFSDKTYKGIDKLPLLLIEKYDTTLSSEFNYREIFNYILKLAGFYTVLRNNKKNNNS
ncbi:hypothetical protein [Fusobacterium sp.]|uniref:hypothetical protein n=1 Tax=Fusobacterium sp. TaxID=68766 RepID=UPI00396CC092